MPDVKRTERGWNGVRNYTTETVSIRKLASPTARIRVYDQMSSNDGLLAGALQTIELQARAANWMVEPADDSPAAAEAALFVESCLDDMNVSFEEWLQSVLSMTTYGFALSEIVYKLRDGDRSKPFSKFDDRRWGWRKLAPRPQRTIQRWLVDEHGGIRGAVQIGRSGSVTIPIEELGLFRSSNRVQSPWGLSLLRSAYLAWYRKENIEEIEAIGIERDVAGIPVMRVPRNVAEPSTDADQELYRKALDTVANLRNDEQVGLVMSSGLYEDDMGKPVTGAYEWDVALLSSAGERTFDIGATVARYKREMLTSLLTDFMLLGHEKIGTQALSVSKIEVFRESVNALNDSICEVMNRHLIPRLLRVNAMRPQLAPKLVGLVPKDRDLGVLGKFVKDVFDAGLLTTPDDGIEDTLRAAAGLPSMQVPDDDDM